VHADSLGGLGPTLRKHRAGMAPSSRQDTSLERAGAGPFMRVAHEVDDDVDDRGASKRMVVPTMVPSALRSLSQR
jgi:hypothetical protein